MEIPTVEALKSRPGWVLEHAIEGQFPKEAGCVRNVLQQALLRTGTLLNTPIHPYHSNLHRFGMVTCEIRSLLNPGLSATWVRAILEPPGIASTVLPNLKAEYGIEITKNTLMSRYGILIADLWDEGLEHRPQNAPVHNTNTAAQDVLGEGHFLRSNTKRHHSS
jgi:hypothetical protein